MLFFGISALLKSVFPLFFSSVVCLFFYGCYEGTPSLPKGGGSPRGASPCPPFIGVFHQPSETIALLGDASSKGTEIQYTGVPKSDCCFSLGFQQSRYLCTFFPCFQSFLFLKARESIKVRWFTPVWDDAPSD